MRHLANLILVFSTVVLLSGCALWQKIMPVQTVHSKTDPNEGKKTSLAGDAYAAGLALVKAGQYEKAIEKLTRFSFENPTSRFSQAALFQVARSYEEMKVWSQAIEYYRQVTTHASTGAELRAVSLYRLSFAYEAVTDESKTVASLLDALARKQHLPSEVAEAEAPARLAAAYARIGNEGAAIKYYGEAEQGIRRLRRSQNGSPPKWLPKTLFYMGTMTVDRLDVTNFQAGIRPLKRGQIYLLQSAELEHEMWSHQAREKLKGVYEILWQAIQTVPLDSRISDETLAQQDRQQLQWDMTHQLLAVIEELRVARLPGRTKENQYVANIFDFLDRFEKRLHQFLLERPVGEGLTFEAEALSGLKRRGRTRGGKTVLEKPLSPSQTLPDKKKNTDPNL